MILHMSWARPLKLASGAPKLIYSVDYDKLPRAAGVYVFARKHGSKFEALYVGKAKNLRSRVRGQQKNLPLMLHLQNAKNGDRILLTGRFAGKSGQQQDKCIRIIEKALIRYFLSEGHDLVNIQGSRLLRHEIISSGAKSTIPELMFVDRAQKE